MAITEIKVAREDEKATAILRAIRHIDDGEELVPVVRCKDCKYCIDTSASSTNIACSKGVNWRAVEQYDFCSYGERREGE